MQEVIGFLIFLGVLYGLYRYITRDKAPGGNTGSGGGSKPGNPKHPK